MVPGMYHFDDPFSFSRSSRISLVVLILSAWPRYQAAEVLTAHRCSSSHSTVDPSENTTLHTSRHPCGNTPVTTVISPVGLTTSSPTWISAIRLNPLGVRTSDSIGCAFPLPTSPWSRRCLGLERARSAPISAMTRDWAAGGEKGRLA